MGKKIVLVAIAAFVLVIVIIMLTSKTAQKSFEEGKKAGSGQTEQTAVTTTPSTKTSSTDEQKATTSKTISYEILQTWEIPNGGQGKVVLIPREYLNEADITALGEKLKDDTKNDRNAFISVFTDKKAWELRDAALEDKLTKEDMDFYDKHYVAQYNKNANSGFNEFVIYFDGITGTNTKTINY